MDEGLNPSYWSLRSMLKKYFVIALTLSVLIGVWEEV
eukprot:CAMPEP_0116884980 /NCGR_PEP_ID=MMETSP0463-20121206/18103_1 /TAXON_ID=181622 /ORGANISM="Strombidinopsis sp, Strain SopsisLIS2011" /LENGTH=36 /DNA_ID= /DNA_START= /DNA_END= /DNA_ORIENTATION=